MIETIKALFRIRQLMEIERLAIDCVNAAVAMDENMNEDERPPDGDDYNTLWLYISPLRNVVRP